MEIDLSKIPAYLLQEELDRRAKIKIRRLTQKHRPKQWQCQTCNIVFTAGNPGGCFLEWGCVWCKNCVSPREVSDGGSRLQKGKMLPLDHYIEPIKQG